VKIPQVTPISQYPSSPGLQHSLDLKGNIIYGYSYTILKNQQLHSSGVVLIKS